MTITLQHGKHQGSIKVIKKRDVTTNSAKTSNDKKVVVQSCLPIILDHWISQLDRRNGISDNKTAIQEATGNHQIPSWSIDTFDEINIVLLSVLLIVLDDEAMQMALAHATYHKPLQVDDLGIRIRGEYVIAVGVFHPRKVKELVDYQVVALALT